MVNKKKTDRANLNENILWLASILAVGLVVVSAIFAPKFALATGLMFEDVTNSAGVAFSGAQFGVSWGDFNNDGWVDIFVNNHWQNSPNLYRNNGDGTFTDIIASSGIRQQGWDPHGSSWGDSDGDGDLDLYITHGKGRTYFYVNQSNGTFVERADAAGVNDQNGRGRTANWIDYNRDGRLDLFKGNEIDANGPNKLYRNNGDGTFADVSSTSALSETLGTGGNVWGDYDDDGDMDVVLTGEGAVRLYRNNDDGTFTNVTPAAKLYQWLFKCWSADFGDYDNDGDLDLYIACGNYIQYFDQLGISSSALTYLLYTIGDAEGVDFQSSNQVTFDALIDDLPITVNQVYIGASEWQPTTIPFTLGASTDHCGQPPLTPGSDAGVFVWQDCPGGSWHFRVSNIYSVQGRLSTSGSFTNVVKIGFDSFPLEPKINRLYRNRGDGTFEEIGPTAGVASDKDSYDATWLDYDNDGWLDLYVVNSGNLEIGRQANHLYRNNSNGTFSDVAAETGVQSVTPGFGDCATWADYDHNGFLDLFVVKEGTAGYYSGPHKLYRNSGNGNHWLQIKLVGTLSNRQGIGSKVTISSGGSTQTRSVNNGAHYLCQNDSTLHFGLGNATSVQTVTVTWPNGRQQVLGNVAADQILSIVEPRPAVTIVESDGSTNTVEGRAIDTYTLNLTLQPTTTVTVTISPNAQVAVSTNQLTFTPINWATPQTVTVTAVADTLTEGVHTGTITHTVASADSLYDKIAAPGLTVNIFEGMIEYRTYLPVILSAK